MKNNQNFVNLLFSVVEKSTAAQKDFFEKALQTQKSFNAQAQKAVESAVVSLGAPTAITNSVKEAFVAQETLASELVTAYFHVGQELSDSAKKSVEKVAQMVKG